MPTRRELDIGRTPREYAKGQVAEGQSTHSKMYNTRLERVTLARLTKAREELIRDRLLAYREDLAEWLNGLLWRAAATTRVACSLCPSIPHALPSLSSPPTSAELMEGLDTSEETLMRDLSASLG